MFNFDYLTTPFCFAHTMIKEINITITMQHRSSHTAGREEETNHTEGEIKYIPFIAYLDAPRDPRGVKIK